MKWWSKYTFPGGVGGVGLCWTAGLIKNTANSADPAKLKLMLMLRQAIYLLNEQKKIRCFSVYSETTMFDSLDMSIMINIYQVSQPLPCTTHIKVVNNLF